MELRLHSKSFLSRLAPLVTALPFALAPFGIFHDRQNYLNYATRTFSRLFSLIEDGVLSFLFNEPIWLGINATLGLFLPPELVVRAIIILGVWLLSWSLLRNNLIPGALAILIILHPAVAKNYIIHLRQGLALGFFMFALFRDQKYHPNWKLLVLTPFIHSSFFISIGLLLVAQLLSKIKGIRILIPVILISLSALIVPVLSPVGQFLGARQASSYVAGSNLDVSGLGMIAWAIVFSLIAVGSKGIPHSMKVLWAFGLLSISIYLSTYLVFPSSYRILDNALPVIIIVLYLLRRNLYVKFAIAAVTLMAAYSYFQAIRTGFAGWINL